MLSNISTYIYAVYQCKSVSLAAKELYISQPALSSAIKREEDRLGFRIFNRKTLPLTLTPEGKCYIEAIEKVLQIKRDSMEKIQDIRNANRGTLRIGTSTHLSFYAIPKILKEFQKLYPKIDIHILIGNTSELPELLQSEKADIIFTSEKLPSDEFKSTVLLKERFIVSMPHEMVPPTLEPYKLSYRELLNGEYGQDKIVSDLSPFHNLEFIYSPPKTIIQKKSKILFGKDELTPYITSNASRLQLNYNLMCAGFGALLTTDANIATMRPDDSYTLFVLNDSNARQDFSIVTAKSNPIAEKFIALAQSIFRDKKLLDLSQI